MPEPQPFGPLVVIADPSVALADEAARRAVEIAIDSGVEASLAPPTPDVAIATATALASGSRYVGVAGDDRSFQALVQGVTDAGFTQGEVTVAIIPADPTCDLIRTFGLPNDPARAARHLSGDNMYELDLARVIARGPDGDDVSMVFAQVSEIGAGAELAKSAVGRPPATRARGRFLTFWRTTLRGRTMDVAVTVDRKTWKGSAANIVIGNCIFFHDGLRVSPRSYPGDNMLDVLVMHGTRADAITMLPKMYRGDHLPHPSIEEFRAKIGVSVDGDGLHAPVHADGVLVGTTPVRYVVMPGAVKLKL